MNKVLLIGNLTKDPEISKTANSIPYCRFTLAVSRNYAKDGKKPETDFLPIIVWRQQAENCQKFLKKGSRAAVCGSIQTRTFEKDGKVSYITEIAADEVQFLSTKNGDSVESNDDDVEFDDLKGVDDETIPW